MRRAHPDDQDEAQRRVDKKPRWAPEELAIMARHEARLTGTVRFMNEALHNLLPDRTLDAIKGQRRKQEYVQLVARFRAEHHAPGPPVHLNAGPAPTGRARRNLDIPAPPPRVTPGDDIAEPQEQQMAPPNIDPIRAFLSQVGELNINAYQADRLDRIVDAAAGGSQPAELLVLLGEYIDLIFPVPVPRDGRRRVPVRGEQALSRRRLRRVEYARTQYRFKKHPSRCVQTILDGPIQAHAPPREIMVPYWEQMFVTQNNNTPGIDRALEQDLRSVWQPLTMEEIRRAQPPLNTAPGPDSITPRQWRAVPDDVKLRIFSIMMLCGGAPGRLLKAKTTLIPKVPGANEPGHFRPITVSSIVIRHLNSILAHRVSTTIQIDPRQRAFQPVDGCAINISLLDLLLRSQRENFTTAHIAVLDVAKAFDTVSHQAIYDTLQSYGFPGPFIGYLQYTYLHSSTSFVCDGWRSGEITPARGVKQGDPLSPSIFNLIVDRVLRGLPSEIGARIGEQVCNAIAFADDLILAASTRRGLEILLRLASEGLAHSGLRLNPAKCRTISLKGQPKQKTLVLEQTEFYIDGNPVPTTTRADSFNYLGVPFDSTGRAINDMMVEHRTLMERLTKAPLKPQQRMHALRVFVLPRLLHRATLGNVHLGVLKKVDVVNRRFVRRWLDLPADAPNAYFHAPVRHGGLGIRSLRWHAPLVRRSRLSGINLPGVVANTYLAREIDRATKRLNLASGVVLTTQAAVEGMWRERLRSHVDGAGLRQAEDVPAAHRWICEPTNLLRASDFVNSIKCRINALPTRARTARGRPAKDRFCRAGCQGPETLNHVLQQCPRTHDMRVRRHDAVVNYVAAKMAAYNVEREPRVTVGDIVLKPDIVAVSGDRAAVLDAQVITDAMDLDLAFREKVTKYSGEQFLDAVRARYRVREVSVSAITINWRGLWSQASAADLLARDIVARADLAVISARVLVGGIACFKLFNRSTTPAGARRRVR